MAKKNNDFFVKKKDWSTVKDELLTGMVSEFSVKDLLNLLVFEVVKPSVYPFTCDFIEKSFIRFMLGVEIQNLFRIRKKFRIKTALSIQPRPPVAV